MAEYLTNTTDLTTVADAIRNKGGTSAPLAFPDGFATAIGDIPTGITPTGTKTITANGTYDVTQFASAAVNVQPTLQSKTLTLGANAPQTVTPDSGKVLSSVPVSLDTSVIKAENIKKDVTILGRTGTYEGGGSPVLETRSLTVTENGTQQITPSAGFDGIGLINLITNVAGGGGNLNDAIYQYFLDISDESVMSGITDVDRGTVEFTSGRRDIYFDEYDSPKPPKGFLFIRFPEPTDDYRFVFICYLDYFEDNFQYIEIGLDGDESPTREYVDNPIQISYGFWNDDYIGNIEGVPFIPDVLAFENGVVVVWEQ